MYYICYYVVSYLSTNKTISFDDELFVILQKRAKKNRRPFATYINELLWRVVKDEQSNTASISPTLVVESLRNALTRSKKSSPMKTELVTILSAILKDESASPGGSIPVPVEDENPDLDDFLEKRKQKQTADEKAQLENTDVFRPNGAMQRAIERGGATENEQLKKYVKASKEPKRVETNKLDDWHPDEE